MRVLVWVAAFFIAVGGAANCLAKESARAVSAIDDQVDQEPATDLDDVIVSGLPLEQRLLRFIQEASSPVPGRGLARWQGPVCIGVVNFRAAVGQQLADGLAHLGGRLGVPINDEACEPNIIIVGAVDAKAVARGWVERGPREFRPNLSEASLSRAQLTHFATTDAPVRWWAISRPSYYDILAGRAVPTDSFTGRPEISVHSVSLQAGRTRDDLQRLVVVVDVSQTEGRNVEALTAYLAMVSFAQMDMQADMREFDTVLNLFNPQFDVSGLTAWDEAYLRGLYSVRSDERINADTQSGAAVKFLEEALPLADDAQ
ncbi:MAG: hypothetical protein Q8S03_17990 [Brevundimonas sp.]|uniref:hypothetical protein n=1 Tax=Brevundimonas sp. TaxID=1871086 RepID=UPI00273583FE|nr:hypothetical protein [Brevundimonas sp.]MDP3406588.1 hypothetical protein [Brevundimonas sp.]